MVKVLTVPGKDKILGVTLVGEHAGDLISEFVMAMKHGLGLNKILGTIHIPLCRGQQVCCWRVASGPCESKTYQLVRAFSCVGAWMIDAALQPLQQRFLQSPALVLAQWGVKADQITLFGFLLGVMVVPALAFQAYPLALLFLLLNRLADGLMEQSLGSRNRPTGVRFLDISCDFVFYALFPLGFALADPVNALPAAVLISSFVSTGSSFPAYAVIAAKRGETATAFPKKGLYYLGGLTEGFETIILFVSMCLFPCSFLN